MYNRELTKEVNLENEFKLINNLYSLLDEYADGELSDYIHYCKIV